MSTSDKIQSIIAQRQPLAQKLSEVGNHFSALHESMQTLEQERRQQLECWRESAETSSSLQEIDLGGFQKTIQEKIVELRRLQGRLSRQTLNIGVIGRMGQGKSTLLKSLTGLQDDVIPALPGKACTAARSTIAHQQGAVTSAEILFHSEASFLQEVILPYYHKLKLTPTPTSFEDFAYTELSDLPNQDNQTHINIYNRLKNDYHTHAKKYQKYLNRGSFTTQEQPQISNYVAQKYNQSYELINHECLAVKHVKIQCSFPVSEIGSIALVDVPGLGDFRLGDESLVIEALAQEVDFILFIRKPSKDRANFEQNDTYLYNLANKALNDLRDRSLFVLNIDRSKDNQESCRSLQRDIESNLVEMPVLDCVIADCSSQDEANSKVLHSVLENLETPIQV